MRVIKELVSSSHLTALGLDHLLSMTLTYVRLRMFALVISIQAARFCVMSILEAEFDAPGFEGV